MKRKIFILWTVFFPASCFVFENPVDPKSGNYVGFPVEIGINAAEFSESDYGECCYPALVWTSVPESVYYLEFSKNEDFSYHTDNYQGVFSASRLITTETFTQNGGWFIAYNSQYLDRLGAGTYFVRASVSNESTGNRFVTWSRPTTFTQKLKQIKAGWADDSNYSVYSYTNDGLYKKEDAYYLYTSVEGVTEARHIETIVYGYDSDGFLTYEGIYTDPKAQPSHYRAHFYYSVTEETSNADSEVRYLNINQYYSEDFSQTELDRTLWEGTERRIIRSGKIERIEYFTRRSGTESETGVGLSDTEFLTQYFHLSKERIYNYSGATAHSITENHYNTSTGEVASFFVFNIDGSAIVRGEYYDAAETFVYAYDVIYYDNELKNPEKAVYTYADGRTMPDYLYRYNFSTYDTDNGNAPDGSIVIVQKNGAAENPAAVLPLPEAPAVSVVF